MPSHRPHSGAATAWLFAMLLAGCVTTPADTTVSRQPPAGWRVRPSHPALLCLESVRRSPRPLRLYAVGFDLRDPRIALTAIVAAPDPDGRGPAHTRLRHPESIATNAHLIAAINANSFGTLANQRAGSGGTYVDGMPVSICGAAAGDGRLWSPAHRHFGTFWIDAQGQPRIGAVSTLPPARLAVAGFTPLLLAGTNAWQNGDVALHPRSAVGYDAARRRVWLVAVDGRQPGYSEGVTRSELAGILRELGCYEALNLDGGGSTALLVAPAASRPATVINRPSGIVTRPVPVLLGVRARNAR